MNKHQYVYYKLAEGAFEIDSLFWVFRYFRYIAKSPYIDNLSVFKHIYVLKCLSYERIIMYDCIDSGDIHIYQFHWNSISIICCMRF